MAYGMILTSIGAAKLLSAATNDGHLVFDKMVWGDASGVPYTPTGAETALVHQVHQTSIVSTEIVDGMPNVYKVVGAISSAPSEFILREVGILDAAGDLIAIGNHAPLTVPAAVGADFELNYSPSFLLVISPDLAVAVTLQPPSDYATEEWVTANFQPLGTYVKTVTGSAGIIVEGSPTDRDVRADKAWFDARYKPIGTASGVDSVTQGNAYIAITGTSANPKVGANLDSFDSRYRGINDPFPLPAHRHPNATQATDGFMSATDKTKLDGLGAGFGDGILTRVASTIVSSPIAAIDVLNVTGGSLYLIRGSGLRMSSYAGQTANLGLQLGKNSTLYASAGDYVAPNDPALTPTSAPYWPLPNSVQRNTGRNDGNGGTETQYRGIILCAVKLLNSASRKSMVVRAWQTIFDLLNVETAYPGVFAVGGGTSAQPDEYMVRSVATEENRIRILPVGSDAGAQFVTGRVDVYKVG